MTDDFEREMRDWIDRIPVPPEPPKYPCPSCRKIYRKEKVLVRHMGRTGHYEGMKIL